MEKIDLSKNSKSIETLYNKIVRGDPSTSYGVFTVDKNGVLDASSSGNGDLNEFVEEFTDGMVQFGLARVTVPGSDVYKNILLGWCPDNAPAKLRLSFAANFADVTRVLSGYHVQITARDTDDLDVDELLSRVGAAAGARYTLHSATAGSKGPSKPTAPITPKPSVIKPQPVPSKPVESKPAESKPKPAFGAKPSFGAKPTFGAKPSFGSKPPVAPRSESPQDDGWGDEKEIEERDFEKNPLTYEPSAYKPTKVDIEQLRSQKSDTISSTPKAEAVEKADTPVKEEHKSLSDRKSAYESNDDGRLTSMPKPKTSNSVASRYTPAKPAPGAPAFGSKPSYGAKPHVLEKPAKNDAPEGVYKVHGNENGLTPAQAWALKKGKYKVESNTEESGEAEVTDKLAGTTITNESDEETQKTEEPVKVESEAKDSEDEDKGSQIAEPPITKVPAYPVPPQRNIPAPPSRPEVEETNTNEEEETEEEEKEVESAPTPSLPARSLPPLPSREEVAQAPTEPEEQPSSEEGVTAVAQYDYEKDEDNEVGFQEGDLIVDIEFVDEEWWSGKNSRTGEVGVFPGSYVTVNESGKAPEAEQEHTDNATQPSSSSGKSAIAEYDYEKEEDNEIGFKEGDLIVEIEFVDEDWWSGKHAATGEVGVFPGNYVNLQ